MSSNTTSDLVRYVVYVSYSPEADVYPFRVPEDADVDDLTKAIHAHSNLKPHLEKQTLSLFKCEDLSENSEDLYNEAVNWLRQHSSDRLRPTKRLRIPFPDGPAREEEGKIDVIAAIDSILKAVTGSSVAPAKRALPSGEDGLRYLKRAKLSTQAPSTVATKSCYKSIRESPEEKILEDRPGKDCDSISAALLYDGFGTFLDIFQGRKDVHSLERLNRYELEVSVKKFCKAMNRYYPSDQSRSNESLHLLNDIFSSYKGTSFQLVMSAAIGSVQTDGHFNGDHGAIFFVKEDKEEPVDNKADPEVQLVSYVAHSFRKAAEHHPELFKRWRVPCLGMTVVGPYVRFYAITFIDRFRFVTLTPGLSCNPLATDGEEPKALYTAFAAAAVLLVRIKEDAAKFLHLPPENPHPSRSFPYVHKVPKYDTTAKEEIDFRIIDWHGERQDNRLLFIAELSTDKSQKVLVKFSRQYSTVLHKFCADRGQAPKLLGFQELPGAWCVTVMEYIESATSIWHSPGLAEHLDRWIEELTTLMNSFHDQGFVHGDLREPNILCDGDRMLLVDFDWGGEAGVASYPCYDLAPVLLDGRKGLNASLIITKEDDIRVLGKTVDNLRGLVC